VVDSVETVDLVDALRERVLALPFTLLVDDSLLIDNDLSIPILAEFLRLRSVAPLIPDCETTELTLRVDASLLDLSRPMRDSDRGSRLNVTLYPGSGGSSTADAADTD